ncbi:MAG TPA: Ldh family oxidoreductase, partial [Burkholderiaceae bacterium]|nr:Ldh family oxidoreductase [Burkholderiaceae bacterium]
HAAIAQLEAFATALFEAAGLDADKATTLSQLLVLTDAMGRRTHGLAMVPLYLAELAKGTMAKSGEPEVVKQRGVVALWDGGYLPGQYVVARAIDWALSRAADSGIAAVTIRRSHHIGCLAALALRAVEKGFVALLANSDPAGARVAPYGGTEALFTPDPFAIGYPGTPNPVLVDICASITTTSMTRQKVADDARFEQPWLLDHEGKPTTDPRVLEHSTPRGSLQLIGGLDYGHKGFGLALMVEALSQGLAGHGRLDAPRRWGGNTFLQVIDPELFAGRDEFARLMDHFGDRCRSNKPIDPARPVRMPGDSAARSLASARRDGIAYDDTTRAALQRCAGELGVSFPLPETI